MGPDLGSQADSDAACARATRRLARFASLLSFRLITMSNRLLAGYGEAVMFQGRRQVPWPVLAAGVIAVAAAGSGTGLVLASRGGQPGSTPRPASLAVEPAAKSAVPTGTTLATVRRDVPRYSGPGRPGSGTVPAQWYGRPSVLPVAATRPGWVEVRLAQRPNESTAWVPASDVTLSSTPYRISVDLATTTLSLYDKGRLVLSAPAGVGSTDDPTPTGEYFVAFDEQPPQAGVGYGPFVMVTSAHSPAISDWEGSGDAIIGIHGPLGEDSEIGTTGAKISHGCIRLHIQALQKLAQVPPGTPIDIVG
jgi:lipoprotein-anchoring transpeptidase ErfK/SrfK